MLKRLWEDVPRKINLCNIIFLFLWTAMDCWFTSLLSDLIANSVNGNEFLKAALMFFIFVVGWELLEYVGDVVFHIGNTHIENNAYKNAFNKLYTTSPEALKKANSGYIAGLLNKTVHRKEKAYNSVTSYLILGLLYNVYVVFYLAQFSWIFGVITFVMTMLGISIRIIDIKITQPQIDALSEAEAKRTKVFMDSITNISTVQKLRSKDFMDNKMQNINATCLQTAKRWVLLDEIFFCLYKAIMYMVCPACLLAMFLINDKYDFDTVAFLSFLSITEVKLVHYSKNIANAIKDYGLWKISQEKLDGITKNQSPIYTKTSIENNFHTVSMQDVIYQYETENKTSVTVQIPYFEFNKGDFVAISGESGQGKTTTLNLLSGAIENNNILVDGSSINDNIGAVYIAQDVEMFDMSLRDNLTLGNKVDDSVLIDLLYKVGLGDWFEKQTKGLDVVLGERGVFISTGQRQRLNLIRGLLIKDKEIYLLDEPTSNVDTKTEKQMIDLIQERLAGKTVIIVTHRNEIKKICNKHYKFKDGIMQKDFERNNEQC